MKVSLRDQKIYLPLSISNLGVWIYRRRYSYIRCNSSWKTELFLDIRYNKTKFWYYKTFISFFSSLSISKSVFLLNGLVCDELWYVYPVTYAPLWRHALQPRPHSSDLDPLHSLLRIRRFMRRARYDPVRRIINLRAVNEAFSRFNTKRSQSSPLRKFTFCSMIESEFGWEANVRVCSSNRDRSSSLMPSFIFQVSHFVPTIFLAIRR